MRSGLIAILLASFCFGFLGIFGRWASQAGMSIGVLLTSRFTMAFLLLGIYFVLFQRQRLRLSRQELVLCLLQGILGYAVFSTFYFKSIEGLSVSLAATLLFTYPLWLALLQSFFVQRLRWIEIVAIVVAFIGLVILLGGQLQVRSLSALLFGMGSGITYALYIFLSSKWQKNVDALASSFYVMGGCALGLAVFHWPSGSSWWQVWSAFQGQQVVIVVSMAIVSTIIPMTLVLWSLQRLPSTYVGIVSLMEPLTAAIAGFFVLQETMGWQQVLGSAILLGAVGFYIYRHSFKTDFGSKAS